MRERDLDRRQEREEVDVEVGLDGLLLDPEAAGVSLLSPSGSFEGGGKVGGTHNVDVRQSTERIKHARIKNDRIEPSEPLYSLSDSLDRDLPVLYVALDDLEPVGKLFLEGVELGRDRARDGGDAGRLGSVERGRGEEQAEGGQSESFRGAGEEDGGHLVRRRRRKTCGRRFTAPLLRPSER